MARWLFYYETRANPEIDARLCIQPIENNQNRSNNCQSDSKFPAHSFSPAQLPYKALFKCFWVWGSNPTPHTQRLNFNPTNQRV